MTTVNGTTTTLEQYDAAPVDWTWQVPTNFPAAQTIPPGAAVGLGLIIRPTSPPWPVNETLLAEAGGLATFVSSNANMTVTFCHATENVDGSGAGYDLVASVYAGFSLGAEYGTIGTSANPETATIGGVFNNPTDRTLYLQSMTGTLIRFVLIPHTAVVGTPPEVTGPTTPPPPSTLPPEVVQRKLLDKANPGVTCELLRWNEDADLVTVFLGQKVVLTVEGIRGRLGFHSRGYVITRMRCRWRADASPVPRVTLETTLTLEKINGTLLPGAGTSSEAQDDAGTGAEVSLWARWDTANAGWDTAGWAA